MVVVMYVCHLESSSSWVVVMVVVVAFVIVVVVVVVVVVAVVVVVVVVAHQHANIHQTRHRDSSHLYHSQSSSSFS